jgi:hypothetical protein
VKVLTPVSVLDRDKQLVVTCPFCVTRTLLRHVKSGPHFAVICGELRAGNRCEVRRSWKLIAGADQDREQVAASLHAAEAIGERQAGLDRVVVAASSVIGHRGIPKASSPHAADALIIQQSRLVMLN